MAKDLKAGERVRVYSLYHSPSVFTGTVLRVRPNGKFSPDFVDVATDVDVSSGVGPCRHFSFYPQQCRRLRAKREPRELWVSPSGLDCAGWPGYLSADIKPGCGWIHFREVMPVKTASKEKE